MTAAGFIAGKLRFRGKVAVCATAVSFFVIIISLAISAGYRKEIRSALSEAHGDVLVHSTTCPAVLDSISGVSRVTPVVYATGVVKSGAHIKGASFKGTERQDSLTMLADIPQGFATEMNLEVGDKMLAYFVSDRVQARNFTVRSIVPDIPGGSSDIIIDAGIDDLRRLYDMSSEECSAVEVMLDGTLRSRDELKWKAVEISYRTGAPSQSLPERFPQIFDWLDLIDVNVAAILILMTIVAGFNMISGLLIYLFRNTSTIGTLKSLGMDNAGIGKVFLLVASRVVVEGMLAGNALALLFCLVEDRTHILKLNPDNYFLSFVPVSVSPLSVIAMDGIAFVAIMLMLLLPTIFISKVDPARTVRSL